jgi:hypothetical protein
MAVSDENDRIDLACIENGLHVEDILSPTVLEGFRGPARHSVASSIESENAVVASEVRDLGFPDP